MKIQVTDFDLRHTIESGQCFEWERYKKGYAGVIEETFLYIFQENDFLHIQAQEIIDNISSPITIENYPEREKVILNKLCHYFSLDVDYQMILKKITIDDHMKKAIAKYHGLRVIKQPHFPCLVSFLLSATTTVRNTQAARRNISKAYGNLIYHDKEENRSFYSFPSFTILRDISEQELRLQKTGFRAKYIHESLQNISIDEIKELESKSYQNAKDRLMKLPGIGEKIADCILLYSYHFDNVYPTDTWVKKFTKSLYLTKSATENQIREFGMHYFNGYAGWAQLFLYIYFREGIS